MRTIPYQYLTKSVRFVNNSNITDFSRAYTNYMKNSTKSDIFADTNHIVINLDVNVLYPPLDISVDCLYFTKISTTFPTYPVPVASVNPIQNANLQQQ